MLDLTTPGWEGLEAPGRPGMPPTWADGAKDMVGCALGPSRLWYTVGQGVVTEVYWPRADIPQIRDLGLIVADGKGFWVEVKRLPDRQVRLVEPGVPAVEVLHRHERFSLRLRVCPDPLRDVLLVEVELEGEPGLRPYALLAPHLGASGDGNWGWAATHRGRRVLWAEQGPFGLALLASDGAQADGFGKVSAGYAGVSDAWQDFDTNGAMTWAYDRAGPGNVALTGELVPWTVLALGFAASKESAATLASTALEQRFDDALARLAREWREWHAACEARRAHSPLLPASLQPAFETSAMVLRAHLDRTFPGAMVASLGVPWGGSRRDRGGYQLVRPRDLAEAGSALLANGAVDEAREVLRYFIASQEPDGHWHGSQWLGGKACDAVGPLADTAQPVLLAAALSEASALEGIEAEGMVTRALGHIVSRGPAAGGPGWEAAGGLDAYGVGACIAALVVGARFLGPRARSVALAVADFWNSRLEHWTAARNTALCRHLGVRGYFRTARPEGAGAEEEAVGTDFLGLVRLGLRRADDPLILDSLRVADALLRVTTPAGPAWRRCLGDRHGEDEAGLPFSSRGLGRAWPLLTGERGHYELAAGRDPLPYLEAMAAMAGAGGLLPEQVWDGPAVPARGLEPGRPTGSAMPLAWAHAEFLKLAVSRGVGRPVDRAPALWRRYQSRRRPTTVAVWTLHAPIAWVEAGQHLMVCTPRPAQVHFGLDGWRRIDDARTEPTGLGLHAAELPVPALVFGRRLSFTLRWEDAGEWCGRDFAIGVRAPERPGDGP
jgi:glucoamylase